MVFVADVDGSGFPAALMYLQCSVIRVTTAAATTVLSGEWPRAFTVMTTVVGGHRP